MQRTSEQNTPVGKVPPDDKKKSSVALRWATALVAIPIVLTCVWFGGWLAFAAVLLVVMLGTFELYNMMLNAGYHPLIWVSFGLSVLFLIAAMLPRQRPFILEMSLAGSLLVSFPWLFTRKKLDGAMVDWALTLAISIYLGWTMSFFLLIRGYRVSLLHAADGSWFALPHGAWWLLFVFLGVWGFDAAAFFSGRYFGRHRLAPNISPAKSWEGVIGGMLFSIVAALLLTVRPLGVPWYIAILMGLLLGTAAVFGDLAESMMKRQTRVKDSGQIMPGHGGMLDRIDSLLFAVVVVYVFSQFLGK